MEAFQDLPAPVRYALFGVVVVAVIFLGYQGMKSDNDNGAARPKANHSDGSSVVQQPSTDPTEVPTDVSGAPEDVDVNVDVPVSESTVNRVAVQGIEFAQSYVSYRWDEDEEAHRAALSRHLADDSTVDVDSVFPTGPVLDQIRADKSVTEGEVDAATLSLMSSQTLVFTLHVNAVTTSEAAGEGSDPTVTSANYTLTFRVREGTWKILSFDLAGDTGDLDSTQGE